MFNLLQKAYRFITKHYPSPPTVYISNIPVGKLYPSFIMAEIGINHNGKMELAKKLIEVAVDADCQAVKFQKRTIDLVYTPEELAKSQSLSRRN